MVWQQAQCVPAWPHSHSHTTRSRPGCCPRLLAGPPGPSLCVQADSTPGSAQSESECPDQHGDQISRAGAGLSEYCSQ